MSTSSPEALPPIETRAERPLLRWLLGWALPHRSRIALATVLVLGGSILQVAGPLITAAAIDLYLKPEQGTAAQRVLHFIQALHLPSTGGAGLATLTALYLATLLVSAALLSMQARTMLMTGQLVMRDLRDALFAHLQRLEVAWFSRTPAGRVITRLTNDVEALNELFTSGLVDIFSDVVVLGGIAGILFALDWRLALVAFATLPFMIMLSTWFRKRARTIYREVRTRVAAINTHLQEHLAGMSVVQLARAETRVSGKFRELDAAHRDVNIRGVFYYAVFYPCVELLISGGMAMLLVAGGVWTRGGTLSLGVLVAFLQYVQRFFRPIADLAENYNILQASFAAAE
ncbi:MAG TPA: ABC transporter ATP-binding protein, partial [Thermoanaerobaculaceae bacterium]|nr:ABC transporter ATP-binding protein [Thermoanaerobaculaceae bacterium]